jgi:hypothetical protein
VDRQFFPPNVRNAGQAKLEAQAFLIGTFQQARTEVAVNLDRNTYDLSGRIAAVIVVQETFEIFVSLCLCGEVFPNRARLTKCGSGNVAVGVVRPHGGGGGLSRPGQDRGVRR